MDVCTDSHIPLHAEHALLVLVQPLQLITTKGPDNSGKRKSCTMIICGSSLRNSLEIRWHNGMLGFPAHVF